MTPKRPAIVPVEVWEQAPEPVQVVMSAIVAYYEQRIAKLEAEVRELTDRLNQNSQNSSKPPSSDGPHVKRKPPKPPSGRKPGGQPGHTPHQRALAPETEVDAVIPSKPHQCRRCGEPLTGSDPEPWRQQGAELPPVRPYIIEYQRHRLKCSYCGITTCGKLPAGVAPTCYGPRLASVVALCTGGYRMSKRMAASFCREVLGIELSLGEICQIEQTVTTAVAPAVEEAAMYVQSCDLNIDETPWKEREKCQNSEGGLALNFCLCRHREEQREGAGRKLWRVRTVRPLQRRNKPTARRSGIGSSAATPATDSSMNARARPLTFLSIPRTLCFSSLYGGCATN